MNFGSSTRLTGAPRTSWTSVAIALLLSAGRSGGGRGRRRSGGSCGHRRGGLANRGHDVVVARAAADVALDRVADLVVAGAARVSQEVGGGHDHAGRAEAALEAVLLPERLL